jgi:CheY-like chemotaxis protein
LGLDISKQLCQMHGGDLTAQSVVGQGSTFEFYLPVIEVQAKTTEYTLDEIASTSKVFAAQKPIDVGWTVMLIEDEASMSDLLRRTLQSTGYLVMATDNAQGALEMALGILPDTILLDLPDNESWHLLQSLKAGPELTTIPVILCLTEPDADRASQLGATLCLNKPITAEQVLAAVQKVQQLQSLVNQQSKL